MTGTDDEDPADYTADRYHGASAGAGDDYDGDNAIKKIVKAGFQQLERDVHGESYVDITVDILPEFKQYLIDTAEDHEAPDVVLDVVAGHVNDVANKANYDPGKEKILNELEPPLNRLNREKQKQELKKLERSEDPIARIDEDGIGIDEYVEQKLSRVVREVTNSARSESNYIFEFSDGARVKFEDSDHRRWGLFSDRICAQANIRVVSKFASHAVINEIDDSLDTDFGDEKYRELSVGPEERPWGHPEEDAWWDLCISSLEDDAVRKSTQAPVSDAVEQLQHKISTSEAGTDLTNVVKACKQMGDTALWYDDDHEEIYVPTETVDSCYEDRACSRRDLRYELDARGMLTDRIAGAGASKQITRNQMHQRFWLLDASNEEVPEPAEVTSHLEVRDDSSQYGPSNYSTGAAADGGGSI